MIKIVFCLHRLPEMTRAEFHHYWRTVHGPLVARHADALGIRRYVQSHALDPASYAHLAAQRGTIEGYDGVAELWIDAAPAPSPQAQQAARELLEDERRFIDLPRSCLFATEEHELVPLR